ncbi:hypothetical protein BDV25DRAFT_153358, partial [Aspergillus avenaceus]
MSSQSLSCHFVFITCVDFFIPDLPFLCFLFYLLQLFCSDDIHYVLGFFDSMLRPRNHQTYRVELLFHLHVAGVVGVGGGVNKFLGVSCIDKKFEPGRFAVG